MKISIFEAEFISNLILLLGSLVVIDADRVCSWIDLSRLSSGMPLPHRNLPPSPGRVSESSGRESGSRLRSPWLRPRNRRRRPLADHRSSSPLLVAARHRPSTRSNLASGLSWRLCHIWKYVKFLIISNYVHKKKNKKRKLTFSFLNSKSMRSRWYIQYWGGWTNS